VQHTELLMGPAERADVIMDFTNLAVGTEVILQNLGPTSRSVAAHPASISIRPMRPAPAK
jgi:FtsP/CotA-like multicopper oxidase with cupredoxin domain